MFYQQSPIYAIVIIIVFIVGYLFIKSRRSGSSGLFGFMKGNAQQQNSNMDDVITMMMLQQLFNNSNSYQRNDDNIKEKRELELEETTQEILKLLDD
ncbi:hypothetical protein LCGC14_1672810 [marine sediment metagenome]|uniref:Uncharacterized protein n=1 Tax=marine sediment metagenome TaxID=412755 RepID=A0A0F9HRI0_9ZZZZ